MGSPQQGEKTHSNQKETLDQKYPKWGQETLGETPKDEP